MNLRKVDRNFPNLGNQLEKLKADREERESKTNKENKSAASSVEFLDEVIHITGQPVTQEPGTEENDRSGSPLTPLARGWVPLYTGTETPQASGEEPTSGKEPPKDGEMSPSKDSSSRQQTVTLFPGGKRPIFLFLVVRFGRSIRLFGQEVVHSYIELPGGQVLMFC